MPISTPTSTNVNPLHRTLTRGQSSALVVLCTFIGAAAQILFKIGAANLPHAGAAQILANPFLLWNAALFAGLSLYGLFTLLFIFALRDGELSVVYPIISLNYVWVMGLSVLFFHEALNPFKVIGVLTIVAGVVIVGRGGGK